MKQPFPIKFDDEPTYDMYHKLYTTYLDRQIEQLQYDRDQAGPKARRASNQERAKLQDFMNRYQTESLVYIFDQINNGSGVPLRYRGQENPLSVGRACDKIAFDPHLPEYSLTVIDLFHQLDLPDDMLKEIFEEDPEGYMRDHTNLYEGRYLEQGEQRLADILNKELLFPTPGTTWRSIRPTHWSPARGSAFKRWVCGIMGIDYQK